MLLKYNINLITKEKKVTNKNYQSELVLIFQGGLKC